MRQLQKHRHSTAAKPRRSSWSQTRTAVSGAILINPSTLERRQLVQMTTVAVACTAVADAVLLSPGRLCSRQGKWRKTGVVRTEFSNTQRQKHWEDDNNDGKRLAAFHGSPPVGKTALSFKHSPSALEPRDLLRSSRTRSALLLSLVVRTASIVASSPAAQFKYGSYNNKDWRISISYALRE
jgi:hypothetical protein